MSDAGWSWSNQWTDEFQSGTDKKQRVGVAAAVPGATATFTFTDGNNGTFNYTVNDVTQTKAITREILVAPGTVCE